ncbi:unnamed protein product [Phaedon cochleariae]|uniref:C3H1-type domain-containing protein n=1 Tax=Phaedon cochleariae TaxID=80249 RepID=A0A9P0DAE5_PHACE|nr:unnamed protein product [Phaedon cochleariae]
MALVCDIKSNCSQEEPQQKTEEEQDLEDGEIEDDGEEVPSDIQEPPLEVPPPIAVPAVIKMPVEIITEKEKRKEKDIKPDKRKHDEKGKKHMTEAERSILHLRKREEMQRKKWEKIRPKDVVLDPDDDFAKKIEKTLATILNKKEKEAAALTSSGGEEKDKEKDIITEVKRGKKRKKNDKDNRNKQRRFESPKSEIDENEMLNMRGRLSPDKRFEDKGEHMLQMQSEESHESECSVDTNKIEERVKRRENKKGRRNREQRRDRKNKDKEWDRKNDLSALRDSQGVCVFYLQGKCQKDDCPYSHEAVPPMKLELCKFYLMDCCAKGDKCSYMHSEFPCKFYHTGLKCAQGDDCKFAHGKPLSDGLKQILFKHIETAPRDILGGFPRMSREEALNMINTTQSKLQEQHGVDNKQDTKGGIPSLFDISVPVPHELLQGNDDMKGKLDRDKPSRNRPSRWQDPEPVSVGKEFSPKSFIYGQDQDMRISSNGDVDMRTLPLAVPKGSPPKLPAPAAPAEIDLERYQREAGLLANPPNPATRDVDIRPSTFNPYPPGQDVDIRHPLSANKDIDIRQMSKTGETFEEDNETEPMLRIDTGEEKECPGMSIDLPMDLPRTHRDLFMRIKTQQKEVFVESEPKEEFQVEDNINWYSDDDDDDDNRLTIKVEDDFKEKEEAVETMDTSEPLVIPPPQISQIKPQDVVEKLGDLSKIDISAEVTKLLTSMSQAKNQFPFPKPEVATTPAGSPKAANDPRPARQDPRMSHEQKDSPRADPRLTAPDPRQRSRNSSTETQVKSEKLSIYEQGSIDRNASIAEDDIDIRGMRSDVDLRNLQLPFKGMQNYTPASEIDASLNSHLPMPWRVATVEIPRPDYTGLKLSVNDAEKTGDPRLRKIFRLSIEERDTPLSPKASPKAGSSGVRVDPRLRKVEEANKVAEAGMSYNQQLTMLRSSAFYMSLTGQQKMLLNQELSLRSDANNSHDPVLNNLLTNLDIIPGGQAPPAGITAALSMLSTEPPAMGLLGPAPFAAPINFDPRNGGLLGNAPMGFGRFPPPQEGFGPPQEGFYVAENGHRGGGRGFDRERRRGGRGFHGRNNNGRSFRNNRNNRSNRTHSPP